MAEELNISDVLFESCGGELLDEIEPLWMKLHSFHRQVSTHFSEHFPEINFEQRKKALFSNMTRGNIKLDVVRSAKSSNIIGYCLSSIRDSATGKMGEIESIYLEPDYRGLGIGGKFMRESLLWMDSLSVKRKVLGVGVGNEVTFRFYEKYNFFPRTTILEQRSIKNDVNV
ncbi:MAG: GNAT family N-acetyltransferase [Calditrichaeota bacterium]|nr:GNAT family N-acetyltransferase [Calditrichota bacterium]